MTLFDDVNDVLASIAECMTDPPSTVFVSHGAPPADCCEFLAAWVENLSLMDDENFPSALPGDPQCGQDSLGAEVHVRLLRNCYPVMKGKQFPSTSAVQAASERLARDGQEMLCCVLAAYHSGDLLPDRRRIAFLGMAQLEPEGGCAGWELVLTLELAACCDEEPD